MLVACRYANNVLSLTELYSDRHSPLLCMSVAKLSIRILPERVDLPNFARSGIMCATGILVARLLALSHSAGAR